MQVLLDRIDRDTAVGRSHADAPEIGLVYIPSNQRLQPGDLHHVAIERAEDYDLFGRLA